MKEILKTKFSQLKGGLNKMTISKFINIISERKDIQWGKKNIFPIYSLVCSTQYPAIDKYLGLP